MKLEFNQRQMQGSSFHLTTVDSRSNHLPDFHSHDYYEIFWIDAGRCQHDINGQKIILEVGDLVLMRPDDYHRLRGVHHSSVRFTNVSIAPDIGLALQQRFGEEWRQLYGDPQLPRTVHFSRAELENIMTEANRLAVHEHSRLALEHFVLGLWLRCLRQGIHAVGKHVDECNAELPDWLQALCLRIEEPDIFQGGVPAFVRLSGKSAEHLSRECRRYVDMTPSQIVNRARMRYAAYQLRMSTRRINDIAQQCGFDDPGRFYRLFKKEYKITPRKYRLQ